MEPLDLKVKHGILDYYLQDVTIVKDKLRKRIKFIIEQQDKAFVGFTYLISEDLILKFLDYSKNNFSDLQFHYQTSTLTSITDLICNFKKNYKFLLSNQIIAMLRLNSVINYQNTIMR